MTPTEAAEKIRNSGAVLEEWAYCPALAEPIITQCVKDQTAEKDKEIARHKYEASRRVAREVRGGGVMKKQNCLVCPKCGHITITNSAYTTCDSCNTFFYASQSVRAPNDTKRSN